MILGKWDGGYSEGSDFVTIGFCMDETAVDPVVSANGTTKTRLVSGFATFPGNSQIQVELRAFECFIHSLDVLLTEEDGGSKQWTTPPLAFTECSF